jgi:hypothetical protein
MVLNVIGLAIGDLLGFNNAQKLYNAHIRLFDKLPADIQGNGPGDASGRNQLLAQSVAAYLKLGEQEATEVFDREFISFIKNEVLRVENDRVYKEYPELKKWGGILRVEDYGEDIVKSHVRDLAKLPKSMMLKLKKAGLSDIHIAKRGVSQLDHNDQLKGFFFFGYSGDESIPKNITWDDVSGLFNAINRSVSAGYSQYNLYNPQSTILHEMGHAIGQLLGFYDCHELIDTHIELFDRLNPYFKTGGAGGLVGRQELFAQGVADYLVLGEEKSKEIYGEKFISWIKNKVLVN